LGLFSEQRMGVLSSRRYSAAERLVGLHVTETDPNPDNLDPLRNKLDPIKKTGPDKQHELFRNLSKVCHGFGSDEVIGAAINLLVNAIRGAYSQRGMAERRWNELFGQFKEVLLSKHYDPVTGKRRNVFPFTQHIHMPLVEWDDKHYKT
jgi:hypothetical protein